MDRSNGTPKPPSTRHHLQHPILILIRGLPGSGKSYLAQALQQAFSPEPAIILDPDTIDKTSQEYQQLSAQLTKDGVDSIFHPNRFLKAAGYKAITAGKVIIWNQAFTDLGGFTRSMGSLQAFAAEHDIPLPTLVVELTVGHDTAKSRVAERASQGGHDVSEAAFKRFINSYASFSDQGFNLVTINGEDDRATSVAAIMQALQKLNK